MRPARAAPPRAPAPPCGRWQPRRSHNLLQSPTIPHDLPCRRRQPRRSHRQSPHISLHLPTISHAGVGRQGGALHRLRPRPPSPNRAAGCARRRQRQGRGRPGGARRQHGACRRAASEQSYIEWPAASTPSEVNHTQQRRSVTRCRTGALAPPPPPPPPPRRCRAWRPAAAAAPPPPARLALGAAVCSLAAGRSVAPFVSAAQRLVPRALPACCLSARRRLRASAAKSRLRRCSRPWRAGRAARGCARRGGGRMGWCEQRLFTPAAV